jgi:hypothetical protein
VASVAIGFLAGVVVTLSVELVAWCWLSRRLSEGPEEGD